MIERGECEDQPPNDLAIPRLLALPYAGHPDYKEFWRP
jgi:hypothetical protein